MTGRRAATALAAFAALCLALGAGLFTLVRTSWFRDKVRQRLVADTPAFAEPLRALANLAMPGVWITGFVWDAASNDMEIRGRTTDPALLPEYIQRLNREPALRGRAFAALNIAEGKPEQPAAGSPATASRLPPFHEFTLVPIKREDAAPAVGGGRG